MNKTIYLRDEEAPIWERARELAGDKLSPVIVTALRRFIVEQEAKAKGFERIEVSFNDADDHGIPKIKAFYGRWIFPPSEPLNVPPECYDPQTDVSEFAVAVTAKGAVVFFCDWKNDETGEEESRFRVYPCLEQVAADKDIGWVAREAMKAIGPPVEELDI